MSFSLFRRKRVYADWAATTPLHPRVEKAMLEGHEVWANPSSLYKEGVRAKLFLDEARSRCARLISAKPDELYFTSGGTEANNTIIQGIVRSRVEKGNSLKGVHVVATTIEHSSVLSTLSELERHGLNVSYIAPGEDGIVRAEDVIDAINPYTALVTCMYANNEIGTVQPVSKIGSGIRKLKQETVSVFPIFHVDASQAPLWLSCDMEGLRADAITLDAHKMQGPKGVGLLAVRRGVAFEPLMIGGGQERGKRPTTENLELIAGFAAALEIAQAGREKRSRAAEDARHNLADLIRRDIPGVVINGSLDKRLPNNLNISIPEMADPELAIIRLDAAGIACSTKSSCLRGEENSYVVKNLSPKGLIEPWRSRNTIRLTFDPYISKGDIKRIVSGLKNI